jgi:hypothetical protein
VNLRGVPGRCNSQLQLALGVDNLFDREYAPHLGGYNRVRNPDVALLERLPAARRKRVRSRALDVLKAPERRGSLQAAAARSGPRAGCGAGAGRRFRCRKGVGFPV